MICFSTQDQITKFYFDIAEPLLLCHASVWRHKNDAKSPAIAGFYHAFSLVSSRAFLVDIYHGLSMVPVADACVTSIFASRAVKGDLPLPFLGSIML